MSGAELTALVLTLTGLVTAVFLGVRNLKSDKTKGDVDKAAGLLAGYDKMLQRLEAEVARLEAARQVDREEHRAELEAHKAECHVERQTLAEEHAREMILAYEQIDVLNTKIYILENKPLEGP